VWVVARIRANVGEDRRGHGGRADQERIEEGEGLTWAELVFSFF
jgi:hypothetical protein